MASAWTENGQEGIAVNTDRVTWFGRLILDEVACDASSISILITDNAGIQAYNRSYLNRDRPTSVISFPMQEGEPVRGDESFLGDIVISVEMEASVAEETAYACQDILLFYLIHGILHLCGYSHENVTEVEAARMEKKQTEIFRKIAPLLATHPIVLRS